MIAKHALGLCLLLLWAGALGCGRTVPKALPVSRPALDEIRLATWSATPATWQVIDAVDLGGRRPFRPDLVLQEHVLAGSAPDESRVYLGEAGKERRFEAASVDEGGAFPREFTWAYARVESDRERVVLAELSGALRGFINGAGFVGDLYRYGFRGVPVLLREGVNEIWLNGGRRGARFILREPPSELVVADWDMTRPDLVAGQTLEAPPLASVLLLNASTRTVRARMLECEPGLSSLREDGRVLALPALLPLSITRVALPLWGSERAASKLGTQRFTFALETESAISFHGFDLEVRAPSEPRLVSFASAIDGSVQACGVLAASDASNTDPRVVLTLHGAAVEPLSQLRAYSQKPDFQLIAPTNRRPFGFDWQDWGRLDAYEALDAGLAALWHAPMRPASELRVYLTGHSMGGHGTWHLAANDPDRFLAIAPSAGWVSVDSYGSRPKGELAALWHAADSASDTLAHIDNLATLPTYILHGEDDHNVPLREAQTMVEALTKAGGKPQVHFEPGAGHWWDGAAAEGADCVDWPPIFELFRSVDRRGPAAIPRPKSPELSGSFKRAFARRFALVVGTAGSAEETRISFERARFEQQVWAYRANGSCDLVSDEELLKDAARFAGRNLILFGNADTNRAWSRVFAGSPLEARRGRVRLGKREWRGAGLGAVFVRPNALSPTPALAAAFADSGPLGARSAYLLAVFASGVGYPDYAVWGPELLTKGDGGVLAAGWFDAEWQIEGKGFMRP